MLNKTYSLRHIVYLVGLHIYIYIFYKMIYDPYNVKIRHDTLVIYFLIVFRNLFARTKIKKTKTLFKISIFHKKRLVRVFSKVQPCHCISTSENRRDRYSSSPNFSGSFFFVIPFVMTEFLMTSLNFKLWF